ncbi:MAG: PilZ domain-containing protein, partial [Candidatus Zixiibacteriota bacterium]
MEDRRKSPRYTTGAKTYTDRLGRAGMFSLTDLLTDRPIGHMIDVSLDGFKMMTWKQIDTKTIYNLRLVLPEDIYGSHYIVFAAECIWCKQQRSEDSYVAGFRIWSVTPENSRRIEQLIELLKGVEVKQAGS